MLNQEIINDLAKNFQIAPEQIAREAYEIFILQKLSESSIGKSLIFKGGTALRLVYGSPRFSEDLDFSLIAPIDWKKCNALIKNIANRYPEISIDDMFDKHYTHFVRLKIKEDFLPLAFSIKLEISKRVDKKTNQYKLTTIESPASPLTVIMNVVTEEDILNDKISATQTRNKPRDIFDLWFLSEKLYKKMPNTILKFDKSKVKQELHKFLPKKYHHIVKMLIEKYANTEIAKKN